MAEGRPCQHYVSKMEKESKDADTVQTAVAIRSWATFKSEKTEKPPCQVSRHRGFSLKTALVKKYILILLKEEVEVDCGPSRCCANRANRLPRLGHFVRQEQK